METVAATEVAGGAVVLDSNISFLGGSALRKKITVIFWAAVSPFLISGQMFAHHSDSVFDQQHYVKVSGTVTQFDFINPHILIYLDVTDSNGNVEQWIASGGPPNHQARAGWNSRTVKAGEKLTITGFQYRDGRKIMLFQKIVRANGEEVRLPDTVTNFSTRQGKKPD